jgi:hypothetical protein
MGNKVTQKEVARVSGLNVKTVRTHFDSERIDVQQIVRDLNSDDNFIYDEPAEDNQLNFNDLCYSIGKRSMFNLYEMIETTRSTQNEDDNLFHIEFGTGELRRSG